MVQRQLENCETYTYYLNILKEVVRERQAKEVVSGVGGVCGGVIYIGTCLITQYLFLLHFVNFYKIENKSVDIKIITIIKIITVKYLFKQKLKQIVFITS